MGDLTKKLKSANIELVSAQETVLSLSRQQVPLERDLLFFLSFDKIELGREEALTKDLELELTLSAHFIFEY